MSIRDIYIRQIAQIEAMIAACDDDFRRKELERNLEIEKRLIARLDNSKEQG